MNKYRAEGGIWAEDPEYPAADWRGEAGNDDTRLGYWEWVDNRRENAADRPDWARALANPYSYGQLIQDLGDASALLQRIGAGYNGRTAGWTPENLIYEAGYLLNTVDDLNVKVTYE